MTEPKKNRLMLWDVTTPLGVLRVETRDRLDWVSDASHETRATGAFASISYKDAFAHFTKFRTREAEAGKDAVHEARETTHRSAVEALIEANGWTVATYAKAGEDD